MRLYEFIGDDKSLKAVLESGSSGGTSAGSIASVATPIGGVIKRMPSTPNLFGYIPPAKTKTTKKKRKSSN